MNTHQSEPSINYVDVAPPAGRPNTAALRASRALDWRWDIQALRGLAVTIVIVNHSGFSLMPGGFLGVDIFFVVSGFLMTNLIVRSATEGQPILDFYARRIRRLAPASYATVVCTLLLGALILDPYEFRDLFYQAIGSFTLTTNYVLWKQVSYFNSDAALKPLLHMWSLSVEEQFYLLYPILLTLVPARLRMPILALLVFSSGLSCAVAVERSPSAAFYFLPFRAWELGIGALAAVCPFPRFLEARASILRLVCAAFLIVAALCFDERGHPGIIAWLVCISTAIIIACGCPQHRPTSLVPLCWTGDRSYSLYLVHWPIFAFANNIFIGPVSAAVSLALLALTLLLSEVQYQFVERRLRKFRFGLASIATLLCLPVLALGLGFGWLRHLPTESMEARAGNIGMSSQCLFRAEFERRAACVTTENPEILVWGDSFAAHLVDAFLTANNAGVVQATKPVCGPFLEIAPMSGAQYKRSWAEECIRFNRSVLAFLADAPYVKTVVISSALVQYLPKAENIPWRILASGPSGFTEQELNERLLESSLAETANSVRKLGKRIVFVTPPPSIGFDIGRCIARENAHLMTISPYQSCNFTLADYRRERKPLADALATLGEKGAVEVISFEPVVCPDGKCRTRLNNIPLYGSGGHLTAKGSREIGEMMKLTDLARQKAN